MNKVVCPICNKQFKELNNMHLKKHGLSVLEFDEKFPDYDRVSKNTRIKKANGFLGKCHSEEYKNNMKVKMKGVHKGRKLTEDHKGKISEKSKKMWKENYIELCKSRTIDGYIDKYGEVDGIKKWISKNKKISKNNRNIDVEDIEFFERYKELVRKITKLSIRKFGLENIEKVGRNKYHVDHKMSICYGFNNKIPAYITGSIYNLEVIKCRDNCSKQNYFNSINPLNLIENVVNDSFYNIVGEKYKEEDNEIRSRRKI